MANAPSTTNVDRIWVSEALVSKGSNGVGTWDLPRKWWSWVWWKRNFFAFQVACCVWHLLKKKGVCCEKGIMVVAHTDEWRLVFGMNPRCSLSSEKRTTSGGRHLNKVEVISEEMQQMLNPEGENQGNLKETTNQPSRNHFVISGWKFGTFFREKPARPHVAPVWLWSALNCCSKPLYHDLDPAQCKHTRKKPHWPDNFSAASKSGTGNASKTDWVLWIAYCLSHFGTVSLQLAAGA